MGTKLKFFYCLLKVYQIKNIFKNAEANSGNQGLFVDGEAEGCQVCQDQEEQRQHQIQGPVQSLLVHFGGSRSREGREAEAVFASGTRRQRAQVDVNYGEKRIISKIFNDYLKRRFIVLTKMSSFLKYVSFRSFQYV